MKLIIRRTAADQMEEVKNWVEDQNTEGAGDRWLNKLLETLKHAAQTEVKHAICKDEDLAKRKYRCFIYSGKWVVAYQIKGNKFIIYRFVFGAKLV